MAYNLDAIKEKLNNLANKANNKQGGGKNFGNKDDKMQLKYWKPTVGNTDIRVLPFNDGNGQPVQEILFYDNKMLGTKRFVAPYQFGKDDPINDMFTNLSSGPRLDKNVYKMLMQFRAKPSYYVPLIVRGREDEGVMFWELNEKNLQKLYMNTFAHPDYEDEDLTDLNVGHDFAVVAHDTGKVFGPKDSPVLEWSVSIRKKSTKVAKTEELAKALVDSIPDVKQFQLQWVKTSAKIQEILDNALAGGASGNDASSGLGASRGAEDSDSSSDSSSMTAKNQRKALDDAFADL